MIYSLVSWPAGIIPVEIFSLIVSYLPRSTIQDMRLVNKEFDLKVSEALFRTVVVPFRPEIYGIAPEGTANELLPGSILLQDEGMRVFQGFGRWIQKFAMSFEIDTDKLAAPPQKADQEVIQAFWGFYKWPFKTYNRYAQLEGLEQTADETRSMAKALRYISSVKELALSIDGGLGWLPGPDINSRVHGRGEKLQVFGDTRFVPETPKPKQAKGGAPNSSDNTVSRDPTTYGSMLQNAGVPEEDIEAALQSMLAGEDVTATTMAALTSTTGVLQDRSYQLIMDAMRPADQNITFAAHNGRQSMAPNSQALMTSGTPLTVALLDDDDDDMETEPGTPTARAFPRIASKATKETPVLLKPNSLTTGQREMLLEMEWAQNAFMHSWVIAIMDNTITFAHVQTLTIARINSGHLSILSRADFWDSLPCLKKLSLAVTPDWRVVKKEATNWIQDTRIAPSSCLPSVYDLLKKNISTRKHIHSLHFEWLSGGEYGTGIFARNQHILAAPVVSQAADMLNRTQARDTLSLPHITYLSLKNCWFSPHIMKSFLSDLTRYSLKTIKLDSVSLTACIPPRANPGPVTQANGLQNAMAAAHALNAGNVQGNNVLLQGLFQNVVAPAIPAPAPPPVIVIPSIPDWLQAPRFGSWASIIDQFTPDTTLADLRFARDPLGPEPGERTPTHLTRLEFKSCGYIKLPLDFDQSMLEINVPSARDAAATKKQNEIDAYMMKPNECTLGNIINDMSNSEVATLENAWNMSIDWHLTRPELAADAIADGIPHPGRGRFDGSIEVVRSPNTSP